MAKSTKGKSVPKAQKAKGSKGRSTTKHYFSSFLKSFYALKETQINELPKIVLSEEDRKELKNFFDKKNYTCLCEPNFFLVKNPETTNRADKWTVCSYQYLAFAAKAYSFANQISPYCKFLDELKQEEKKALYQIKKDLDSQYKEKSKGKKSKRDDDDLDPEEMDINKNLTLNLLNSEDLQSKINKIRSFSSYNGDKDSLRDFILNPNTKQLLQIRSGKYSTRSDIFTSSITKAFPVVVNNNGFIGDFVSLLKEEDDYFQKIVRIVENTKTISSKKRIYHNQILVVFLLYVLKRTLNYDKNFSMIGKDKITTEDNDFKIGQYKVGCDKDQLDIERIKLGDYDQTISWSYNQKTYCAYKEARGPEIQEKFFPAYNEAYKGKFSLSFDPENNEYVMYDHMGKAVQQILFGAPGTGKSFKIDDPKNGFGLKDIPKGRKFRTTFHPDYDYAQFVGAYKPTVKPEPNSQNAANESSGSQPQPSSPKQQNEISYSFVPQVFAKAYAAAWKSYLSDNTEDVFLVIEEINRGNCAQIFGDIFQLLDRDENGFSQYSIDADSDFVHWLETNETDGFGKDDWGKYNSDSHVQGGKIALPPNFNILATMNTSDQSLFPMDSAFKRRFDWEYVPIRYEIQKKVSDGKSDNDWDADKYTISFIYKEKKEGKEEKKTCTFHWIKFLKKVNADIYKVTESEDKQMGEFFIKPKDEKKEISLEEFRSKVLFYLWDAVYKDETDQNAIFHFKYPDDNGSVVTFQRLFEDNFGNILLKILERLDNAYNGDEFKDFKILEKNS